MGDLAPTYAEQEAWRRADHDLFPGIGAELDEAIPHERWAELDIDERRAGVEKAAELLRKQLGVKRPALLSSRRRSDESRLRRGLGRGRHPLPKHHLEAAEPEHLVRGLAEEVRHAWQDDVRRGLTEHPLGEMGRRSIEHAFKA